MVKSAIYAVVRYVSFVLAVSFSSPVFAASDIEFTNGERAWFFELKDDPDRFVYLDSQSGYLDNMTGLVWFAVPGLHDQVIFTANVWTEAVQLCETLHVSGLMGWRLPSIQELATIFRPVEDRDSPDDIPGSAQLNGNPEGYGCDFVDNSPFGEVMNGNSYWFWSITEAYGNTGGGRFRNYSGDYSPVDPLYVRPYRYILRFDRGRNTSKCIDHLAADNPGNNQLRAWCVRGGSGPAPRPPWSFGGPP